MQILPGRCDGAQIHHGQQVSHNSQAWARLVTSSHQKYVRLGPFIFHIYSHHFYFLSFVCFSGHLPLCLDVVTDLSCNMTTTQLPRDLGFAELCIPAAVYLGYQISKREIKSMYIKPMEASSTSHPEPSEPLPWQGSHHPSITSFMPFIPFHVSLSSLLPPAG